MNWHLRLTLCSVAALMASAQTLPPTYINQTKFNSGQDVVPSFDGWLRNPDGTFTMVFGYMNRNYQEEPVIPAGPDNKIEPGPVDRAQPTYFLTRRHAWASQHTAVSALLADLWALCKGNTLYG